MTAQTSRTGARLRVALLGAGRWGSNLVRILAALETADLRWVVDPDPAARRRVAGRCGTARLGAELEPALEDTDAFVVCTPVADHHAHARRLLAAGKHVLLEKPMALSVSAAGELVALAARADLTLMVGHQLLYHPLFVRLVENVRSGAIGALLEVRAERSGPIDLDREPDALWAFAPHDVAMVGALTGEAPVEVTASGVLDPERRVPVDAVITLGHASGVRAAIRVRRSADRVRRLTAFGTDGELELDDSSSGGRLRLRDGAIVSGESAIVGGAEEPLLLECRHFVDRIRLARPARTDGAHGLAVTAVLERASRGLRPVPYLSWPSSSFMNSSKKTKCLRKRMASKALT